MFKVVPSESENYTHELVGEPDAENALDGSIEKWSVVAAFLKENSWATVEDGGHFTCPLCLIHYANYCDGCPIEAYTGAWHCNATPYTDYADFPSLDNAEAEVEFLYEVDQG